METIKNYLENMFMNLPNTAEVRKAKDELWQMMEDKYTELMDEGKTENEAVGTVISEFGNLSELAEALGIDDVMNPGKKSTAEDGAVKTPYINPNANIPRRMLTSDQVAQYLSDKSKSAFMTALGVLLCITSVTGPIISDAFGDRVSDGIGVLFMFLFIAGAVALFILSGKMMSEWSFLKKEPCTIDFATSGMVKSDRNHNKGTLAVIQTIGVVLCILSVVPAAILDELNLKIPFVLSLGEIGGALLFVFVGVGVFMIVYATKRMNAYKILLGLNDNTTMAGAYKEGYKAVDDKTPKGFVQSVYWPTVTCIYLAWSFLTFDWHITWIIWPVAAILSSLLNTLFEKED